MARSTKTGERSSGEETPDAPPRDAPPRDAPPRDAPPRDAPPPDAAAQERKRPPRHGGNSGLEPDRRRPPPEPATQQRGWAALTMGVLSLVGLSFIGDLRRSVYVIVLAMLIGLGAAWLGISAMRRARRGVTGRPRGALAGTVLGIIGIAFSAIFLIVFATFWNQLSAYSYCMGGANTLSAQQACQHQFNRSVGTEISILSPHGHPSRRS